MAGYVIDGSRRKQTAAEQERNYNRHSPMVCIMMPEPIVYVVDDDTAVLKSLRWLIESVGLTTKSIGSASSFLEIYEPSSPGCLVLDVRMPGMTGLQLQALLSCQKMLKG